MDGRTFRSGRLDLEQLDGHDRSGFDDVGLSWNFDVSVGVRHAGDVAGGFERGLRESIPEPDRIELMPARRRDDPARQRRVDGRGAAGGG